jgi:hypothetical protein
MSVRRFTRVRFIGFYGRTGLSQFDIPWRSGGTPVLPAGGLVGGLIHGPLGIFFKCYRSHDRADVGASPASRY